MKRMSLYEEKVKNGFQKTDSRVLVWENGDWASEW
jgi:hypothetical protein